MTAAVCGVVFLAPINRHEPQVPKFVLTHLGLNLMCMLKCCIALKSPYVLLKF